MGYVYVNYVTETRWCRSAIEEDYSKRMHALGNRVLGKDELGSVIFS